MEENAWMAVGNKCLDKALHLLDRETISTVGTVEAVKGLVEIAIKIDKLNLLWAQQSQYGAAVFQGRPSSQQPE